MAPLVVDPCSYLNPHHSVGHCRGRHRAEEVFDCVPAHGPGSRRGGQARRSDCRPVPRAGLTSRSWSNQDLLNDHRRRVVVAGPSPP